VVSLVNSTDGNDGFIVEVKKQSGSVKRLAYLGEIQVDFATTVEELEEAIRFMGNKVKLEPNLDDGGNSILLTVPHPFKRNDGRVFTLPRVVPTESKDEITQRVEELEAHQRPRHVFAYYQDEKESMMACNDPNLEVALVNWFKGAPYASFLQSLTIAREDIEAIQEALQNAENLGQINDILSTAECCKNVHVDGDASAGFQNSGFGFSTPSFGSASAFGSSLNKASAFYGQQPQPLQAFGSSNPFGRKLGSVAMNVSRPLIPNIAPILTGWNLIAAASFGASESFFSKTKYVYGPDSAVLVQFAYTEEVYSDLRSAFVEGALKGQIVKSSNGFFCKEF